MRFFLCPRPPVCPGSPTDLTASVLPGKPDSDAAEGTVLPQTSPSLKGWSHQQAALSASCKVPHTQLSQELPHGYRAWLNCPPHRREVCGLVRQYNSTEFLRSHSERCSEGLPQAGHHASLLVHFISPNCRNYSSRLRPGGTEQPV